MRSILHSNEYRLSIELVHSLLSEQMPAYAELPLTKLGDAGSTNVLFRLGEECVVRLPRQPGGGEAIAKEHRWLPLIAPAVPCAVPEVLALGKASDNFPEPWSISRWIEGVPVDSHNPEGTDTLDRRQLARDLAEVILALRLMPVPPSAFKDPSLLSYRGDPLIYYHDQTLRNIELCKNHQGRYSNLDLNLDRVTAVWHQSMLLSTLPEPATPGWYHADLVAENLLLSGNGLAGVLDFGSLGVGDPTIDLHGAWEILDPKSRGHFRELVGVDDDEWLRGRAWALAIAIGAIAYYWNKMPRRVRQRLDMANAVLTDAEENGFG